jgi:GTPase-associated protein 1, N-terminal domain type 1
MVDFRCAWQVTMSSPIKVDQALHGYSRGHKELAASLSLDTTARAQMLGHSDLLVGSIDGSDKSYITGYPLKSQPRYVLSKTWLAGKEMRPGSVWTHSLILELPALTMIHDLSALTTLFREPVGSDFEPYARPIKLQADAVPHERVQHDAGRDPRARLALEQLYGPDLVREIRLPTEGQRDGDLAIALWRQMWPAMRRKFAFVGGPVTRVPNFSSACTLFFQHGSIGGLSEVEQDPRLSHGLDLLCSDLGERGPTSLRSFIGRYAIEADEPRTLVPALAILHSGNGRLPVRERLARIVNFGEVAHLPRLISDTIVSGLVEAENEEDFVVLIENYRAAPAPRNLDDHVAPLVDRHDIDLSQLLRATQPSEEGQLGHFLYSSLVAAASPASLVRAAREGIDRHDLLQRRPDLWNLEVFWPTNDAERVELVRQSGGQLSLAKGMELFTDNIGPGILKLLLADEHKSAANLIRLLNRLASPSLELATNYVVANPSWIDALAVEHLSLGPESLEAICEAQLRTGAFSGHPEAWINLILKESKSLAEAALPVLIIGFAAALNTPATRSLPIAQKVYDPLVRAVRAYRLNGQQERFVLQLCPASAHRSSLRRTLAVSAVEKWHADAINPQALGLSKDIEALKDIVSELVEKFGRAKFESAAANISLPPSTRENLRKVYQPKTTKKQRSIWWWDW